MYVCIERERERERERKREREKERARARISQVVCELCVCVIGVIVYSAMELDRFIFMTHLTY